MNVANVIPLSATHADRRAKSERPAALNSARVRFGAFELDEANALLLRNGKAVTLAPKPFAVLCALARRPGSLLTKHALLDDVWGHQFVTDSVLKTAISEVRAALDDDPKQPRYIETVSRRGYRFIAATIGASSQRAPAIERERRGWARPSRPYGTHGIVPRRCGARRAHPRGRLHAGARAACPQRVLAQTRLHMNHSEQRLSEVCRQHTEAIVAHHVHELFKRLPMLSGFWLRPDLEVAELSVFTWPGYTAGQ